MINTIFNMIAISGSQIYSKIHISPALPPFAYSSSVVTNDMIVFSENNNAVTVPLIPTTYNIKMVGDYDNTEFTISLPTVADGTTVNASDYIVSAIPSVNYNAASSSFARFSISSSYALTASYVSGSGGGGGTSLTTGSTYPITASVALNSISTSFAPFQVSSSYASTSSVAISASYAPQQTVTTVPSASWASQSLSASYITASGIVGTVTSASYVRNAVSASFVPAVGNTFAVQFNGNTLANGKLTGSSLVYRFGQLGVGTGTAYTPLYDVDVKASSGTTANIGSPFNNVNILAGFPNPDNGRYVLTLKAYDWLAGLTDSTTITLDKDIILMPESSSFGGTKFGDSSGNANVGIGDYLNPQVVGLISQFNDTYIAAYDSVNDKFIYSPTLTVDASNGRVGINQTTPTLGLDINGSLGSSVGALQIATDMSQVNTVWSIGDVDGTGNGNTLTFDRTSGTNTLSGVGNSINGNTEFGNDVYILGGKGLVVDNDITASMICVQTSIQMPYSASNHSLTPKVNTGSMYFKVSGSTKFLFVYNGTKWVSSSMA